MAATLNTLRSPLTFTHSQWIKQNNRILVAIVISLALHLTILFGVTFQFPTPNFDKIATSLDVVLVNNKTITAPTETKTLAQENLDGGGNTDEDRRAKTPFPILPKNKPNTHNTVKEQKTKELMAAIDSDHHIAPPDTNKQQSKETPITPSASDLLQNSLEIARLKAQIAQNHDSYQKRPRRRFVGARTKEYRFARYVEDWRLKVERIGNLNYPEAARRDKLYGSLQLTVGIRADGSLESIGINRSSGEPVLDEAAIRIVRLAGQNGFAAFPPDISRDTDILHITRTWAFSRADQLVSQ